MNILRIYPQIPPCKGGMEQHIKNLTIEQIKQGHSITLVYNQGNKINANDIVILSRFKLLKIKPQFIGILFFYIIVILKLIIKKHNTYDVIHIHGDWSSLLLSKIIKMVTKAKLIIYSNHGKVNIDNLRYNLLISQIKKADIVFCTGYETFEIIKKITKKKVIFQPSGIRGSIVENKKNNILKKNNYNLLTIANFVPVKNIGLILDIAKKMPHSNFYIIGDGPLRKKFEDRILNEKINNVTILGYLNDNEICHYFKICSIYLMTSIEEGFPTSILEAMHFGLPIISSNAGKIEYIIKNGINGFTIKGYNLWDYVNYIEELQNNNTLYSIISGNNEKIAKKFCWERVASNISFEISKKLN